MTYLLDTNVCIRFLNQPDSGIAKRLQQQHVNDITVCSVMKSELFFGAMKSRWPDRTLQKQLAFLQVFKS
jgi:tRNA(fMet)-specific endonuclease VapC